MHMNYSCPIMARHGVSIVPFDSEPVNSKQITSRCKTTNHRHTSAIDYRDLPPPRPSGGGRSAEPHPVLDTKRTGHPRKVAGFHPFEILLPGAASPSGACIVSSLQTWWVHNYQQSIIIRVNFLPVKPQSIKRASHSCCCDAACCCCCCERAAGGWN